MRAFVKDGAGAGNAGVRTVADPVPGRGQVVIAVRYAGLCHTDVSMLAWNDAAAGGYRPTFPLVMGHEYTGTVAALGPGVTAPAVGTRVVGSAHVTCGACASCRGGRSMLCRDLAVLGLDVAGVFAEYAAVPARNLVPVPPDVPDRLAALAEPYAVAAHAVATGAPTPGERVAVVGPGTVGLCATAAALAHAPSEVSVFGTPADTRQSVLAARLGATAITRPHGSAPGGAAEGTGDPEGAFDLVVEAAGHPDAVARALRLCRPGGRVITAGLPARPLSLDTAALARAEQTLTGVRAYDLGEWPAIPSALAAAPTLIDLVTHTLSLRDVPHAADLLSTRATIKTVIDPSRRGPE